MSLKRRDFVKLCSGTVAGFGISQMFHPGLVKALEAATEPGRPPVVWMQGNGCTGCSVSILNSVNPSIADVVLKVISLECQETLSVAEGSVAVDHMLEVAEKFKGKFYYISEGAIPTAENGAFCTIGVDSKGKEWTVAEMAKLLGSSAAACVAVGACATGGGIPGSKGNVTGCVPLHKYLESQGIKTPVINITGCPPHPDWMVGTLVHVLTKGVPELDAQGRPTMFFGKNIHDNCPFLPYFEKNIRQKTFTEKKTEACRADMGCKGPLTSADCFSRKWNNGTNWCVENAICIGCAEIDWPDAFSPLYSPVA